MRFSLELDAWDLAALVGLLLVVVGLFAWHWPAALVATGAGILGPYTLRECRAHAAEPPAATDEVREPD